MTIYTDGLLAEPEQVGIHQLPLSTGSYVAESFTQGLEESPVAGLLRAREVAAAGGRSPEEVAADPYLLHAPAEGAKPAPTIPMGEAKKRVKEAGLEHQIPNLGDGPEIGEGALDVMMRHARERQHREAQLARGPSGFLPGVAATGAGFFAGALDPLNIAAFSIPVVGESTVARLMASAGESAMARAGVRAGVGAAQGAVGTLPLIPLDAMAYSMDGRDYGFADALKSIAMNAGLGGVLHAAGGGIADVYRSRVSGRPLYPFAPGEPFERTPGTPPGTPPVPPPPDAAATPPVPPPPPPPITRGMFPGVDELIAHPEVAGRTAHPKAGFNVSDVLSTPRVAEAIEAPDINREHDVPYGSLAADAGGVFIDRNVPAQAEIDGVRFSPALPLNVARQVEREALERLTARFQADKGREPTDRELEQMIRYTDNHYVTPAEKAWVTSRGIDWDKYQEAKREWHDKIDHENPAHPPEGAYTKPLPPRLRDRLRGGARPAEPPPAAPSAPPADTTGLASMGGNMAAGISESLHEHLWDRIQNGEVTETRGMPPSAILQAAKVIRSRGGLKTFEEYKAFADDYGRNIHEGTPTFQQDMRALVERHVPQATPAAAQPSAVAEPPAAPAEPPVQEAPPASAAEPPPAAAPSPEDTSAGALAATFRDEVAKMRAEEAAPSPAETPKPQAEPAAPRYKSRTERIAEQIEKERAAGVSPLDLTEMLKGNAGPITSRIPNKVMEFAPGDITIDAARFQFKSGGDAQGVTDRLRGVDQWDQNLAGMLLVWESADGKFYVADGHQRAALANRIAAEHPEQNPRLVARVLSEKDGITDRGARTIAALTNIAEGTGTAIDAAKILRDEPDLAGRLPPRSELVRQARGLANLEPEAFRMVIDEVAPANYAAIVGRLAPKDGDLQKALIGLLEKTDPANVVQAESIVRFGLARAAGDASRLPSGEEIGKSLFTERARILDLALKDLRRDKVVFTVLSRERERIEEAGNTLAADINEKRRAADEIAVQILQTLAARDGPVADALHAAAERLRADGRPDAAVREFVARLRGMAESGELARLADSGAERPLHAGAQDAERVADTAPEQPADVEVAKADKQVRRTIRKARETPPPAVEPAPSATEPAPAPPPAPTTAEVAKAAGKAAVSALDEAATGLWELFGKGKRPFGGLPGFDEETYAAAKPHFIKAAYHFREFTGNVHELMRRLVRSLKEQYGFNLDAIEAMEPYAVRFVQDVHEGRIDLNKAVHEQERTAIASRLSGAIEKAGRPREEAEMMAAAVADRYVARAAALSEGPMHAFERANVEILPAGTLALDQEGRQYLQRALGPGWEVGADGTLARTHSNPPEDSGEFWTPNRVDRLREMRGEGKSFTEIGDEFGVSRDVIAGKWRRLQRPPPEPRGKVDVARLRELRAQGMNAQDIAKEFGVTRTGINWHLEQIGLLPTREEMNKISFADLKKLRDKGLSAEEISAQTGVALEAIQSKLNWLRALLRDLPTLATLPKLEFLKKPVEEFSANELAEFERLFGYREPGEGRSFYQRATDALPGVHLGEGARQFFQIKAFHGSPHDFPQFDMRFIGKGEGAQSYGHGLYFAENEVVAKQYRDALSTRLNTDDPVARAQFWAGMKGGREGGIKHLESVLRDAKRSPKNYDPEDLEKTRQSIDYLKSGGDLDSQYGKLYQVTLHVEPEDLIDWDAPLSEQSEKVKSALQGLEKNIKDKAFFRITENDMQAIRRQMYRDAGTVGDAISALERGTSKAEAARILKEAGIPGIKYLDQGSRGILDVDSERRSLARAETRLEQWRNSDDPSAQEQIAMYEKEIARHKKNIADALANPPTRNFVIFDDSKIEITHKDGTPVEAEEREGIVNALTQKSPQGEPQGRVTFTNNARIIELFKKANASTAPHEFGHVWLDELHEDAARPDAPDWLKQDLKTVRDWLGAKGDDPLTTEQHEQFARGFEQYLREGRAPSRRLAAVFAKFAEWMRAIYRKAQDLGVEINDDVRGVMDRMLATHEDIAEYANDRPPLEREPMEHPPAPGEEAGPTVNPATGTNEVLPPVQSQEVLKGAIGSLIEGRPVRAGEQIEGTKEPQTVKVPPGFEIVQPPQLITEREGKRRGVPYSLYVGEYVAVARRLSPFGVESGFGKTPQEAQLNALRRVGAPPTGAEPSAPAPQQPSAASGPRAKDPADRSLFEHLAANGGIKPDADLQHVLGRTGPFVPGWGPLLRPNGKPIDLVVRDGDVEAYLGKGATVRDLMAAINDESRGRKRYQMGNEPVQTADTEASRAAHEREVIGMLEDAGIAREELGSDRIARVIEIMQREHVDNPEVAFEQAVMEEARRHEDAGNAPAVPPELHVPGWDDDGTAAPQEGGVLQPLEPAQGGGTGAPAPSGGQGPRAPPEPLIPTATLADHFRDYFLGLPEFHDKHGAFLDEGQRFPTIVQARRFAKEMGFGDDTKAIDEAIEQGAVAAARAIALGDGEPADKFAELVKLYDRQPRLSVRTSTSMRDQAYSTPVPLAYLASRLARVEPMRRVYEPSAGNGALLMGVEPPEYAVANEINPARAQALKDQGFKVTERDASDPALGKELRSRGGVDAVLANPPFGAVKEGTSSKVFDLSDIQRGYKTHEIDHTIVLRSLEAMKDDGRAVLLIGGVNKLAKTTEARSEAYNGKAKREFFKVLMDRYRVTDMFTVAGELYERQGAGWPIDVIVINGRGKSELSLPAVEPPRVYKTWDELAEVLNAQPGRDEGTPGAEPGATPVELPPATEGAGNAGGGEAAGTGGPESGIAPAGEPGPVRGGPVPGEPGNVAPGAAGIEPPPAAELEPGGERGGTGGPGGESAAGGRAPGVAEPLRLVDALRNSTRLGIGGDHRVIDPHAENILQRSPEDLRKIEAILAANGITELKPLAGGFSSLVFDAGNKVVRLGEGELGPVPDIPEYAKPFAQGEFGSLRIEILPKLDTEGITEADVQAMKDKLARRGLHWGDAGTDNLARDEDGKLKILDGRITPAGDGEAPPAAKIPHLKGAEKSAAPAPQPVKPRIVKTETETGAQVAYTPQSGHSNLGTLVPVNMKKSVADALAAVAERHGGDVDKFVADEIGYSRAQLADAFAAEQVDALALALDNIKQGKGFIIGDQTGIGKGRVNAGIIRWAIRNNRIPIFVTEKPNLYGDMYRDLSDIGLSDTLGREPRFLMTNAGEDVPLSEDGKVRLKSPSAKAHNAMLAALPGSAKEFLKDYDAVFTNYSQMQTVAGEDTARRAFLARIAPEAVVIFDESHNAGGQKSDFTKPGPPDRAAFARQLVAAAKGVFYSSATYAKRPDVMDLYSKTDMRLAVDDIKNLGEAIAKGGVPMQQAVAAMLSRAGQYVRRERSFAGIRYDTPSVPVDRGTYDGISRSLNAINEFSRHVADAAAKLDQEIKAEAAAVSSDGSTGNAGAQSTNFTSIMHNIVGQMLLAMKAKPAARMAIAALEKGEKPVLTVSSTMESFLTDYAEQLGINHGEPIPADFSHVLKKYLERTRTLIIKKPFAKKGESERRYLSDEALGPLGLRAYKDALAQIGKLDLKDLPISPIDAIKNELTQAGYSVGEITGRGTIVDYSDKRPILRARPGGEVTIKGRSETIRRFNGGRNDEPLPKEQWHDAMILNQAGSTGLSLHASERFADQRPRVMYIVQPEANIDTHMQLLGRIHRTGQVVLPRYEQLTADIPAEKRPAAVLAKKMASLNANTTAARGSAMTAKDVPDFLNVYGDMVAAALVQENPELNGRLGSPVKIGDDGRIDAEDAMRKLTGRIPLLPLAEQERLYSYLESEYNSLLDQMKAAGENALEAQTLDLRAQTVERREVVARREASDSPFAAPVSLEKAMVRRLGKPFRSDEVVSKILDNIGHTPPEGVTADNAARLLDDLSSKRTPLGQRAAQVHERQAKDALGRFDDYKRGILDDIDNPDKAEAEREKQDATRDRWTNLHNQLAPGERVNLRTANGNLAGIVLKIEQKGKPKNPLALSTWKVEVAIADATRRIELPFSRLYEEGRAPQDDQLAIEVGHITDWAETKQKTLDRFDSLQSDSLEPRYIATGNLLAAYDWLKRKGRIVNYTDAEGHTRQGILTPKDFDLAKHAEGNATAIGDEKAVMRWLRDNRGARLSTNDRNVEVALHLDSNSPALIDVVGSRRLGGMYYLDKELTGMLMRSASGREQGFIKRGGKMAGLISEANLEGAIRRIQELGGKFVTVKELPPAEQVSAPAPPEARPANPREAWDRLAKEPLPHEEREAVEFSRAAEKMKEPESVATDPAVRVKAAEKLGTETAEQFENAKGYMSDEDRAAFEAAQQEYDREQARKAEAIRQGIACLSAGGFGKGTGKP